MSKNRDKSLHLVTLLIIVLSIITSSIGLFYTTGEKQINAGSHVRFCERKEVRG